MEIIKFLSRNRFNFIDMVGIAICYAMLQQGAYALLIATTLIISFISVMAEKYSNQ